MSYGDLIKAGVGLDHMADVMQTGEKHVTGREKGQMGGMDEKAREMPVEVFYSESDRMRDPERNGGLMAAWKFGLEKQKAEKERPLGAEPFVGEH